MYFIRIVEHPGYAELITTSFKDYQIVVAVKHTGEEKDNPHFHVVIETQLKKPALRARLNKVFNQGKGNGHMAIKEIKKGDGQVERTIQYMFHEEDRPTFWCMGDDEVVKKAREGARKYKMENGGKGVKPFKKKRELTFTEKVVEGAIEEFMCKGLLKEGVMVADRDQKPQNKQVLAFIIKYFGTNKKCFDKFIINRVYNVVAFHLFGNAFVDDMVHQVLLI